MLRKPLLWIAALSLAAVLGLTAQASASTVKGTVVHTNKSAHTFVVADRHGRLTVLSSRRLARAGSVVRASVRKTKNGLKVRKLRVQGHAKHARLHGLVTWASKSGFTVASNGASLLVHKSSSDSGCPVGAPVQSDVTINSQGDLEDDNTQQTGSVPAQMKLEGVVLSTDPTAETITISGDDDAAEAQSSDNGGDNNVQSTSPQIVVHVPDATAFMVGDKVELIVTGPATDGSFTLVNVEEQESQSGQDNGSQNQSDQGGNQQGDGNPGPGDGSGGGSGDGSGDGSGGGS